MSMKTNSNFEPVNEADAPPTWFTSCQRLPKSQKWNFLLLFHVSHSRKIQAEASLRNLVWRLTHCHCFIIPRSNTHQLLHKCLYAVVVVCVCVFECAQTCVHTNMHVLLCTFIVWGFKDNSETVWLLVNSQVFLCEIIKDMTFLKGPTPSAQQSGCVIITPVPTQPHKRAHTHRCIHTLIQRHTHTPTHNVLVIWRGTMQWWGDRYNNLHHRHGIMCWYRHGDETCCEDQWQRATLQIPLYWTVSSFLLVFPFPPPLRNKSPTKKQWRDN